MITPLGVVIYLIIIGGLLLALWYSRRWRQTTRVAQVKVVDQFTLNRHASVVVLDIRQTTYVLALTASAVTVLDKAPLPVSA